MKPEFWHERWTSDQIGFHRDSINPRLLQWWTTLGLVAGSRILVPLCGKSLDMLWLAEQGHRVTGVEISPLAVKAFFSENDMQPGVPETGKLPRFAHGDIEIYCGDFFTVDADQTASVQAVYDRAALVALPPDMRRRYAAHLTTLLPAGARMLLVTMEYESTQMNGPPFSVPPEEVEQLFSDRFRLQHLEQDEVLDDYPGFHEAGLERLVEHVFMLEER